MPHKHILSYPQVRELLDTVVNSLFTHDDRIQSIGITQVDDSYGFRVTRNKEIVLPQRGTPSVPEFVAPIEYVDVSDVVRPLSMMRTAEQGSHRPLVCGLQIQNFDYDDRALNIQNGIVTTGSLGCFVVRNGVRGFISNNHVLAGENSGYVGDQIMQPATLASSWPVGNLDSFVPLSYSGRRSRPALGNVNWNEADIAVAKVGPKINCSQEYLLHHQIPRIQSLGTARVNQDVYKVGQASGLTKGRIVATDTVVDVHYKNGLCWFRNSFEIVGISGAPFSQSGDSGAVVIDNSGNIVGMLYAANPTTAYAFPIKGAMSALSCELL